MNVQVYLLCYNEEVLLPHTVTHYRTHLPGCTITIYDNESTDTSVVLAEALGCHVVSWSSNHRMDEDKQRDIKNTCWKEQNDGWVIVADMDEWLCINATQLLVEEQKGTSMITTQGIIVMGSSQCIDLSDTHLHGLNACYTSDAFSKRVCFHRRWITNIHYNFGAHRCRPEGQVVHSDATYYMKHMVFLGLPFLIDKWQKRFARAADMQQRGLCDHYTDDVRAIRHRYEFNWSRATQELRRNEHYEYALVTCRP